MYENSEVRVACANVTDAHLALLEDPIPLANEGISALAFGDFAGLSGIKEVGLGGNNLTTLPGGVFLGPYRPGEVEPGQQRSNLA